MVCFYGKIHSRERHIQGSGLVSRPRKLLTPDEVAEYLQIPVRTVRLWLREGSLKGIKVKTLWRIPEEELEKFLRQEGRQDK